jgi:hypothetical protein
MSAKVTWHPDAIARDEWLESEEGKRAVDPTTLGAESRMRQYLENRLVLAFIAGIEHGRKLPKP